MGVSESVYGGVDMHAVRVCGVWWGLCVGVVGCVDGPWGGGGWPPTPPPWASLACMGWGGVWQL